MFGAEPTSLLDPEFKVAAAGVGEGGHICQKLALVGVTCAR
jgi:hypothetical protein